jgi:hypothetical protein
MNLQKKYSEESGYDFSKVIIKYEFKTFESLSSLQSGNSIFSIKSSSTFKSMDYTPVNNMINNIENIVSGSNFMSATNTFLRGASKNITTSERVDEQSDEEGKKSTNTSTHSLNTKNKVEINTFNNKHDIQIEDECDIDESIYSEFINTESNSVLNKMSAYNFNFNLIKSEIINSDETEEFIRFSTFVKKDVNYEGSKRGRDNPFEEFKRCNTHNK